MVTMEGTVGVNYGLLGSVERPADRERLEAKLAMARRREDVCVRAAGDGDAQEVGGRRCEDKALDFLIEALTYSIILKSSQCLRATTRRWRMDKELRTGFAGASDERK
jgi:hypothetical protein